jgi:hypothetical protein
MTTTLQQIRTLASVAFWRMAASITACALKISRLLTPIAPYAPAALAGAVAYVLGHMVGLLLDGWIS